MLHALDSVDNVAALPLQLQNGIVKGTGVIDNRCHHVITGPR